MIEKMRWAFQAYGKPISCFMFGSRVSSRGKIDQNRFEEPLEITLGKLILNKENVYRWYWIEIKRN